MRLGKRGGIHFITNVLKLYIMCSQMPAPPPPHTLPDRVIEKMPDAPQGYFLCSGAGLCSGAPDTGAGFPNIPWAALSACRTQDSSFKKALVEKDRPALGDVSGNDRALAAQIPS